MKLWLALLIIPYILHITANDSPKLASAFSFIVFITIFEYISENWIFVIQSELLFRKRPSSASLLSRVRNVILLISNYYPHQIGDIGLFLLCVRKWGFDWWTNNTFCLFLLLMWIFMLVLHNRLSVKSHLFQWFFSCTHPILLVYYSNTIILGALLPSISLALGIYIVRFEWAMSLFW